MSAESWMQLFLIVFLGSVVTPAVIAFIFYWLVILISEIQRYVNSRKVKL